MSIKFLDWNKAKDRIFDKPYGTKSVKLEEQIEGDYAFYYLDKPMKISNGYLSFYEKNLSEAKNFIAEGYKLISEGKKVEQKKEKENSKNTTVVINPSEEELKVIDEAKDYYAYTDMMAISTAKSICDDMLDKWIGKETLSELTNEKYFDQDEDTLNGIFGDLVDDVYAKLNKYDERIEVALGEKYLMSLVKSQIKAYMAKKNYAHYTKYV